MFHLLPAGRQDVVKDKSKTAFVRNVPFRHAPAAAQLACLPACPFLCPCFLPACLPARLPACLLSTCLSCAADCRATEDDLVEFFSQCGTVVDLVRRTNKEGGWPHLACRRHCCHRSRQHFGTVWLSQQ